MRERKAQLLSERCSTCIFRPGNPMHLNPGALARVIAGNRRTGSVLVCHKTLSYGEHPEFGQAMCRGYWDRFASESSVVQLMERLCGSDWYEEVDPP